MPLELSGSLVISGSMTVSGSIGYTGSLQSTGETITNITGSLFGTSSWAVSASWAPGGASVAQAVTASGTTIYSLNPATSNFSTTQSILLGDGAGINTAADYAIMLGKDAGNGATGASFSNFIGYVAGQSAASSIYSNFIGFAAGQNATNAPYSNLIGYNAGYNLNNGGYTTAIGYNVAMNAIGANNIIIGKSVTLPNGYANGINLGGLIFGSGSNSSVGSNFSGSANGRVGINQPTPAFSLDVSGSGRFTSGLTVTGSFKVTGSFIVPSEVDANPATGSMYVEPAANKLWVYTGNSTNGWVTASLGF